MRQSNLRLRVNTLTWRFAAIVAVLAALLLVAACGGDDSDETATTVQPAATATSAPPTERPTPAPEPTEPPQPTAAPAATPQSAVPTERPTPAPEPTEPPQPTAAPAGPSPEEALAAYAAENANGPGAIFVGDPTQLIGPPPHEGLMFDFPEDRFTQMSGLALLGSPELQIPGHMFIFTSDYYRDLIEKANLTNPTELVSSGQQITIQHACIDRQLPTCVLFQTYLAPNIARRTNGQVNLTVTSFAELQIDGQATLSQVGQGILDMVNIYTGYVAGEAPVLEIQSLWGSSLDWETTYLSLVDLAEDVDRLIEQETDGSRVLNRNWFAGADQWIYGNEPLHNPEDFDGVEIRINSASQSDFVRGMGGDPVFTSLAELYTSLDQGIVDAALYAVLLASSAKLFEVTHYMSGPLVGFGYTNNVINRDVWDEIPADLQQIMIEEGARAELEALRLAPFQNVAAVAINQQLGMQPAPFSPETQQHILQVILPEYVIPGWLQRLGFPGRNQEVVAIYNEKSSPYTGLWINEDGTIRQVEITKGPAASQ